MRPPSLSLRFSLATAALLALLLLSLPLHALANSLQLGQPAPPLSLHTLDGKHLDTADLRGQVVVITFWASWCSICQQELPVLNRYVSQHPQQGLRVIGVSLDSPDDLDAVRAIASKVNFPVGLLGSSRAGGYGRIWRLPVSFVIDRSGRLVNNGWKEDTPEMTSEKLEKIVTPLL